MYFSLDNKYEIETILSEMNKKNKSFNYSLIDMNDEYMKNAFDEFVKKDFILITYGVGADNIHQFTFISIFDFEYHYRSFILEAITSLNKAEINKLNKEQ